MSTSSSSIARSLALATAAFVSMPAAASASGHLCKALQRRANWEKFGVRRVGPVPLLSDASVGNMVVGVWSPDPKSKPAPLAVRIEDTEILGGRRVACIETTLEPGEGAHFEIDLSAVKGPTTLGVRCFWPLEDLTPTRGAKDKVAPTRLLGTLIVEDGLGPVVTQIFDCNPGKG